MNRQELLEKLQWNINRALEKGLHPIEIIGLMECVKNQLAQKVLTTAPVSDLVPASQEVLKALPPFKNENS